MCFTGPGAFHGQRRPRDDSALGDQRRAARRLQHEDARARIEGQVIELPSKIDQVAVAPGDTLVFRTARRRRGGADPFDRDSALVLRDVMRDPHLARSRAARLRRRCRRRRRGRGGDGGGARPPASCARADRAVRLRPRPQGRSSMTISLRARLSEPSALVALGAHDGLTARIAERAGVEALYHGGYALAAHHFGLPDVGLVGRAEVVEGVRRMRAATRSSDHRRRRHWLRLGGRRLADDAQELEAAEAPTRGRVQIEDQVSPKRCGHGRKEVIPAEEMVLKVRAAVSARRSAETLIVARSDALQVTGLRRHDRAGCNAPTPRRAPTSSSSTRRGASRMPTAIAGRCSVPCVANMSETGRSAGDPDGRPSEEALGYKLVIFPSTQTWLFAKAYRELCEAVVRERTTASLADQVHELRRRERPPRARGVAVALSARDVYDDARVRRPPGGGAPAGGRGRRLRRGLHQSRVATRLRCRRGGCCDTVAARRRAQRVRADRVHDRCVQRRRSRPRRAVCREGTGTGDAPASIATGSRSTRGLAVALPSRCS